MQSTEPGRRDAPVVPDDAGVTFVMPVLNERGYLQRAVETVLAQEVDGPSELILALAPSTDGTNELAKTLAAGDERIVLVDNPDADIPVGLNRAIRAGRYPTVVRVDAHSELQPEYTRRALATLARVRAANVGGVMRAEGRTPFQRAVARAYNSPVGLGGGAYHGGREEGEAESAYLGVMRRAVLDEVGLFDETIRRGEDWELNLRIRRAGYRVWFDPALSVT
jgi:glycosyltransferase involved in cell wall biosynthesis